MASVHTTANFAELLWPGIKELYGTKYDGFPKVPEATLLAASTPGMLISCPIP